VPWVISDIGTPFALGSVLVLDWEMAPTAVWSATFSLSIGNVKTFSAGRVLATDVSCGERHAEKRQQKQDKLVAHV